MLHRSSQALLCSALVSLGPFGSLHAQDTTTATLAPITIKSGEPKPDGSYLARGSNTATKTGTPLIEIPQSISVITQEQLRQQGAHTLNQALRYTSGVAVESRGAVASRLDQFTIRGFSATSLLDGLRVFGSRDALPQIDAYRLEQVDVLKGPSSVMFGQGGPGGVVNQVSKRPQAERLNEVELQAGNFKYKRANVDFTGALDEDERWLYRLTGAAYKANGQVAHTKEERYFIAPALTWNIDPDTQLTLLANLQHDPHMGSYGSMPGLRTVFEASDGIRLDPDFYDGDVNFEKSDRKHHSVAYEFEKKFNEHITIRSKARYLHSEGVYRSVYSNGFRAGSERILNRNKGGTNAKMDSYALDNHAVFTVDTGRVWHTVLAGVDFAKLKTGTLNSSWDATLPLDVLRPDYYQDHGDLNWVSYGTGHQYQTGVYLQDQMQFEKLSILAGGRYDWSRNMSSARSLSTGVDTSSATRAKAFTGRLGAIYNFDNGLAPYINFSQSFEPQSGTDRDDKPFDPLRGEQYEIGMKFQPPGTSSLYSMALFDIRRKNLLTAIPNCVGSKCQEQTGEIRTQGIELEARGQVTEQLNLIANYSLITNEYTKDNASVSRPSLVGMAQAGIPKHQASLWVHYQLPHDTMLAGLGVAAGLRYRGSSFGDTQEGFKVPGTTLVDMAVDYDLAHVHPQLKGAQIAVNVSNLFNRRNVSSCSSQSWCWYGYQRSVQASLRYRW
ncbi:TonB-dependent siderophore receptor [Alcaligenes endophyticus]|uniref:TonB-dependent siderophore receptor n=1 Tax=Alcaligenes endophyticus TaxID=1929088 RepID=A0ABT8EGJ5_9BURK|nr:TonB-dependent siderophore receptor [Alcaligenes endophyticus]MCX5589944.1 TonB-dependent siderophore receptor [Alcaligenes endophyticus]MDN4120393.1 TonB-dependent siderophore receptor [Alcaligenes endophyticus]